MNKRHTLVVFRGTGYQLKLWACQRGMNLYGEYMFFFGAPVTDIRTMLN